MTGGYSLIDCFDVNITSDPVKIEGIFKKYQMSKRKAFLLSNVTINNTQLNDAFSTPYFEDGKVCFPAYDGVIKISDTDYVTFDVTADVIADKYLSKEDFLTIESDNSPYVSRTARDGLVKIPQLVGGTVAWNQLAYSLEEDNWRPENGVTVSFANGVATFSSTIASNGIYMSDLFSPRVGKYLITYEVNGTSGLDVRLSVSSTQVVASGVILTGNTWQRISAIRNNTATSNNRLYIYGYGMAYENLKVRNIMIIDLTQMFGAAIADYVYSLERATEGSGIAWLKSYGFFTKDYYAYDAGSLQSVCTSGRKITALDGTVRTYPIDNEELRGLFKLDANNKLYADGDIYPPSGAVTRKYGIVDLGTLNWIHRSEIMSGIFSAEINNAKQHEVNVCCAIYLYGGSVGDIAEITGKDDKAIYFYNGGTIIYIKDTSYSDAAALKTAMSGQYLVYELAEETTFSADPYINPQRSEGTEEFVDGLTRDVMIPVGNNSTYYKDELFNIIGEYIDSCDDAVIAMIPEGE